MLSTKAFSIRNLAIFTTFALVPFSAPLLAQSVQTSTRVRWERLVYEDVKATIQETTAELAKNPGNVIALRMRSSAYARNFEPDKSKADATAVFGLLPSPKTAEEFEAKCYSERRLEKNDEAIVSCTRAIELDPRYGWAYYNRASVKEALKDYSSAIADYTKAIELSPGHIDAYSKRGYLYGAVNRDFDKAITDSTKAIELEPNRTSEYHTRGYWRNQKNDFDMAIVDLTKAIELNPKLPGPYYERGVANEGKKQYDKAIQDLTRAIELEPKSAVAFMQRGNSCDRARSEIRERVLQSRERLLLPAAIRSSDHRPDKSD
jgi:tetratricopeptide (TPR) repeat protein